VSPRISDDQRHEIIRLLNEGLPRNVIADEVGVLLGQVSAVAAHLTMRTYTKQRRNTAQTSPTNLSPIFGAPPGVNQTRSSHQQKAPALETSTPLQVLIGRDTASSFYRSGTRMLSLFWVVLLAAGCIATLESRALAQTWSTKDLKTQQALPSGTSNTVTWQVGNYLSGGLQIYGLLCIPTSPSGPYPVAIINHGRPSGSPIRGIQQAQWSGCIEMAVNGWLTAISTYRGESISGLPPPFTNFSGVSDGELEFCYGEVDDVLNLLSAVTALTNANANQVFMWGHSHGSCITERAVEKGGPVQIAVSLDGPTDFTTWSNSRKNLTEAERDARSPALTANNLTALTKVQFLRVQAEGDMTVTPDQACELASRLPNSMNYYLNPIITPPGAGVYYEHPKECSAFSMPWVNSPGRPAQFPPDGGHGGTWSSPTLLMYSGLDHSTIMRKAWPEIASFVNAVAQPGRWHASLPSTFIQYSE
jgi:Prolyl oligopeptidase family